MPQLAKGSELSETSGGGGKWTNYLPLLCFGAGLGHRGVTDENYPRAQHEGGGENCDQREKRKNAREHDGLLFAERVGSAVKR